VLSDLSNENSGEEEEEENAKEASNLEE